MQDELSDRERPLQACLAVNFAKLRNHSGDFAGFRKILSQFDDFTALAAYFTLFVHDNKTPMLFDNTSTFDQRLSLWIIPSSGGLEATLIAAEILSDLHQALPPRLSPKVRDYHCLRCQRISLAVVGPVF